MLQRSCYFLLLTGAALLAQAQNCSNLITNGGFESSGGTGGSLGYPSCTTSISNWVPSITWPAGTTSVNGSVYVPLRNGGGSITENFPNAVMPDSWDANAANTRYLSYRITNSNSTAKTVRISASQTLSAPLQVGTKYVVRIRYAAQTISGGNSTMGISANFNTSTSCPPSFPGGTTTTGYENYAIDATPDWAVSTSCFTATAAHTRFHVAIGISVPATTVYQVHVDAIEVLKITCPYDLNGDGLVGANDLTIMIGYSNLATDNILNTCHTGADSNCDGVINTTDINAFNAAFGTICPNGMVLANDGPNDAPALKRMADEETIRLTAQPNPTHGAVTLTYPAPGDVVSTLTVLDLNGRTVLQQRADASGRTELDLSTLPAGAYAVLLRTGDNVQQVRVVRE